MKEVFQVGAGNSSSSIELPSDSIRAVGSNWMLALDNRVQWKDSRAGPVLSGPLDEFFLFNCE